MKKHLAYLLFLLFFSCNNTEKEFFVINKNIQGYILVVFNGLDKSEKGHRAYTFLNNKIFFSDYNKKLGLTNTDVRLVGDGDSSEIPFILKGQISGIANSELNKKYLILLGGFSSEDVKTNTNLSLNLYWVGELSKLNQNDANRVITILEHDATLSNLKDNSILSLIE